MKSLRKDIYTIADVSRCSGRGIVQGVLRFAAAHFDWRLRLLEPTPQGVEELIGATKSKTCSGIITSEMESPMLSSHLEKSPLPLVVIGTRKNCLPKRERNIGFVTFDERKIGAAGARHLLSLGKFSSFAFVRTTADFCKYLSSLREQGFAEELMRQGYSYETPPVSAHNYTQDLNTWLKKLPKPAAILTSGDKYATEIAIACDHAGIKIPDEIRLLGIDNNEFACLSTTPTISSVITDFDGEGYAAAQLLDRMLRKHKSDFLRQTIICPTKCGIAIRESTRVLPPGLALVEQAKKYIAANAGTKITVGNIANHLHVSRRLLYSRFSEFSEKTLQTTINEAKVKFIQHRLQASREKIESISRDCGFGNICHLKVLFKKTTGMTMREWRNTHPPFTHATKTNKTPPARIPVE